MKIPEHIKELLDKRCEYAKEVIRLHGELINWCDEQNINYSELDNDFGCMVITEPENYKEMWERLIDKV